MSPQVSGERICLLQIKKELLARMLDSVRRSAALLREDDMDAFDSEMDGCKEITEKVDEIAASIKRLAGEPAGAHADEIARLEKDIAYIAGQIESARMECNDVAQQKLHMYGQQIKSVRHTQKGINGYANQFQRRDAVFIDEKK